jgi:ferredoxin-NADP reductase
VLRLGELRGGALHYDPDWQARPLWLLAAGTGLAPLWGILREALRQGHRGEIRVMHVARDHAGHYLAETLEAIEGVAVERVLAQQLDEALAALRPSSRQTVALVCGSPGSVERFARRLFIAGVPRNQVFADVFVEHA